MPPRKSLIEKAERLLARLDAALELRVFERREHLLEGRPRAVARRDQVLAAKQRRRPERLGGARRAELRELRPAEFPRVEKAVAAEAVRAMQREMQVHGVAAQ